MAERTTQAKFLVDIISENGRKFKVALSDCQSVAWVKSVVDKYGEDALENFDGSSSSEEEDDDAQEITPEFEEQFLRALATVRNQDPKIYDKGVDLFQEQGTADVGKNEGASTSKTKKSKPMYLKDYERKIIVEKGGQYSDDDDEDVDMDEFNEDEMPASPTYVEEQKQIRSSFKDALKGSSDEESSEETFLTQKRQTKEEKEKEEEEYIKWLKGERETLMHEGVKSRAKDVESLREYWSNPQLEDDEKFLRDYILDRAYKPDSGDENQPADQSEEDLSEDDRLLEEQQEFERRYNFRFEEPDSEIVKSYPRNVAGSLRKKDTSRAMKRQEVKERKEREKQKLREELKKLKNLKKMEIKEKLDQLKKITGNATVGFEEDDMKGDFNPEQHDRVMQKIFDDQYDEFDEDATKPVFDHEEFDEENWDEWTGHDNKQQHDDGYHGDDNTAASSQLHCEDPGFNMDADYDPASHKKEKKDKRKKKKDKNNKGGEPTKTDTLLGELDGRRQRQKHTSEFAKVLQNERPVFDPEDKTFEEYFEEYYRLDYEDLIGDLPCRFKYRTVVANDFGLSPEEMLGADDKELNRWAALRKTCQYRSRNEELSDLSSFQEKGRNTFKKEQILQSIYNPRDEDDEENENSPEEEEETVNEDASPSITLQATKEREEHRHGEGEVELEKVQENDKRFQDEAEDVSTADNIGPDVGPTRTEERRKKRKREKYGNAENSSSGNKVSSGVIETDVNGGEKDTDIPPTAEVSESKEHRKKNRKKKGKDSSQRHEVQTEHLDERQGDDSRGGRLEDHTSSKLNRGEIIEGGLNISPPVEVPIPKKRRPKDHSKKEKGGRQSVEESGQGENATKDSEGVRWGDHEGGVSQVLAAGTEGGEDIGDGIVGKDDVGKRPRNKGQGLTGEGHTGSNVGDRGEGQDEDSRRSRKKRVMEELRERKRRRMSRRKEISEGRLKAYGIRPTAYKYKLIQERIKNKRKGKRVF